MSYRSTVQSLQEQIEARKVADKICEWYKLPQQMFWSTRKDAAVAVPRHVCQWILRNIYSMSFPSISIIFTRDITTVTSNIKSVDTRMKQDPSYADQIDAVVKFIDPRHRILDNHLKYILKGDEIATFGALAYEITQYAQDRSVHTMEVTIKLVRGTGNVHATQRPPTEMAVGQAEGSLSGLGLPTDPKDP